MPIEGAGDTEFAGLAAVRAVIQAVAAEANVMLPHTVNAIAVAGAVPLRLITRHADNMAH